MQRDFRLPAHSYLAWKTVTVSESYVAHGPQSGPPRSRASCSTRLRGTPICKKVTGYLVIEYSASTAKW